VVDLNELSGRIHEIFPMPMILDKILKTVNDPNAGLATLENLFKYEPSLTLKILTLANSAYFGVPEKVTNIRTAITLLGVNLIKSLAIHASVNELFRFGTPWPSFSGYELWKHSVGVAVGAKMIARCLKLGAAEDFFTLGILHDVGLIIEYQFYREPFVAVLSRLHEQDGNLSRIEQSVLGTDHTVLGRLLCEKWQLPAMLVQIVGFHHTPLDSPAAIRRAVCAVNLADHIVSEKNFGFGCSGEPVSEAVLAELGWTAADLETLKSDFDQEIMELTIFLQ